MPPVIVSLASGQKRNWGISDMSATKSRLWLLAMPLAALALALYGVRALAGAEGKAAPLSTPARGQEAKPAAPPERQAAESIRRTPVVTAVEKAIPSVVNIGTERMLAKSFSPWGANGGGDPFDGLFDDLMRQQSSQRSLSLGSGSVIDASGLVVTNAHVVHRASKINVTLSDGRSFEAKEVAGDYLNDLSLLQLVNPPADLKPIECAQPFDILLGETVMAVGNPFGLDSSITHGVVSAVGRKLTFDGKTLFSDIVQTDAAVYPGNSGGPLINLEGKMTGINMAFHKEAPGIGFAIPLARVENTLAKWLIPERFSNVCLGVVPGLRPSRDGGPEIFVADVIKDSSAEKSGVRKGQRVDSFQGEPVDDLLGLGKKLIKLKANDIVELTVDGRQVRIPLACAMLRDGRTAAKNRLALSLQELTPQLASALGYPFEGGLIVSDMLPDGPQGVERGDLLARLGETPVHNWSDISKALEGRPYGDKIQAVFVSVSVKNGAGYLVKKLVDVNVR